MFVSFCYDGIVHGNIGAALNVNGGEVPVVVCTINGDLHFVYSADCGRMFCIINELRNAPVISFLVFAAICALFYYYDILAELVKLVEYEDEEELLLLLFLLLLLLISPLHLTYSPFLFLLSLRQALSFIFSSVNVGIVHVFRFGDTCKVDFAVDIEWQVRVVVAVAAAATASFAKLLLVSSIAD